MVQKVDQPRLKDGTLVEHKTSGYRGRIEGITEIKGCFTRQGVALPLPKTDETFQYRIAISGQPRRHIAPAEDLEIVIEEQSMNVSCFNCHAVFRTHPGVENKSGGRCECGGWICPECLACDATSGEAQNGQSSCLKQSQRMKRRRTKKSTVGKVKFSRRSLP